MLLSGLALVAALLVLAHLVFRPPPLDGRTASRAVDASALTALGRTALPP